MDSRASLLPTWTPLSTVPPPAANRGDSGPRTEARIPEQENLHCVVPFRLEK